MNLPPVRRRIRHKRSLSNLASTPPPNDPCHDLGLTISYRSPGQLKPPRRKLRKSSPKQQAALRSSIKVFGFLNPVLVDAQDRIICGHARWLAAQDLGLAKVPVVCIAHLNKEQLRLFAIAENRIGELGEWDEDALRIELTELDLKVDVDLELTGFTTSEIDTLLIQPVADEDLDSADQPLSDSPVTRPGDLWQIGDHRLLCGNSLEQNSFERLLGEEKAEMAFADAPYNQPMKSVSGRGRAEHGEFVMASGEMSSEEFVAFLTAVFLLMAAFSEDGSIHFQCMDWHHLEEMLAAGKSAYSELKNLLVWNKGVGGMGTFYRSQHELIFAWKAGRGPHINTFGLGETGRYRTNVWDYRGNNAFHAGRDEELAAHPTVKPVALVADAIRDCSHRGGIVLDPFGGAGTTLLASEIVGRRARLIEIDPRYCDRTIERWQKLTGREAVLSGDGVRWSKVAEERGIALDSQNDQGAAPCAISTSVEAARPGEEEVA